MEKDFKKEYSEHIKSETPDLWARIEGNLIEKENAPRVVSIKSDDAVQKKGKKRFMARRWMMAVPAAAAVLLLVTVAPIFMPKGMEKAADEAYIEYGMMAECEEEDAIVEEAKAEGSIPETYTAKNDMAVEQSTGNTSVVSSGGSVAGSTEGTSDAGSIAGNTDGASDSIDTGAGSKAENDVASTQASKEMIEVYYLHLLVVEQLQDTNLLSIDKEHIGPVFDLYLIEVDGEEKVLAVPPTEEEVAFEIGMWYDLTVTDSTEYGIDYIWVE